MHSFLRAIGFKNIKSRQDEERLIHLVIENATEKQIFRVSEERAIVEMFMEVSEETGVVSIAQDGKLTRFLDMKTVEKMLLNI